MITVGEIKEKLNLNLHTGEGLTEKMAGGCYIGDLLSLAMSKVQAGNVWITIQTNINIAAVASLTDAACIIIADGLVPDDATVNKANVQDIIILSSEMSAYELAIKLSEMGI